jgi:hypothetical protein
MIGHIRSCRRCYIRLTHRVPPSASSRIDTGIPPSASVRPRATIRKLGSATACGVPSSSANPLSEPAFDESPEKKTKTDE